MIIGNNNYKNQSKFLLSYSKNDCFLGSIQGLPNAWLMSSKNPYLYSKKYHQFLRNRKKYQAEGQIFFKRSSEEKKIGILTTLALTVRGQVVEEELRAKKMCWWLLLKCCFIFCQLRNMQDIRGTHEHSMSIQKDHESQTLNRGKVDSCKINKK